MFLVSFSFSFSFYCCIIISVYKQSNKLCNITRSKIVHAGGRHLEPVLAKHRRGKGVDVYRPLVACLVLADRHRTTFRVTPSPCLIGDRYQGLREAASVAWVHAITVAQCQHDTRGSSRACWQHVSNSCRRDQLRNLADFFFIARRYA